MNYQGNNPEGYPDPTANQAGSRNRIQGRKGSCESKEAGNQGV